MIETSTQQCPKCSNMIPVDPGYPVWCDHCEWNLDVPERGRAKDRHQRVYLRASAGLSERLLRRVIEAGPVGPTLTFPKALGFVIAGLAHLFVVTTGVVGVWLLYNHFGNLFLTFIGALLLVMAFVMRPRLGRVPEYNVISREQFPTLYQVADAVAAQLGTRPVDLLLITPRYNASFFRAGWSRKSIVTLGMPLLAVLNPQERVALIAHELAHGANGDAARSFVVGGAIRSLMSWHNLFAGDGDLTRMVLPVSYLLLGTPTFVGMLLGLIAQALVLLLANDSQRAEYRADSAAARVGGTEAMLGVLRKLHMGDAMETALGRFYEAGGKCGVFEMLRRKVETVPPREIRRVARIEKWIASRLDASHPPTAYRMEALNSWPSTHFQVVISDADSEAIERELLQIRSALEDAVQLDYKRRNDY